MNKNFGYKILIIDDDKDLTKIISDMLTSYGFKVSCAENADSAFEILTKKTFHIILIDINLPEGDGFEVCRELRQTSAVPIIFASARSSESDRITGYDIGGDDYLPKPYSMKELLAHINAIIRRTYGFSEQEKIIKFGDVSVNIPARSVLKMGNNFQSIISMPCDNKIAVIPSILIIIGVIAFSFIFIFLCTRKISKISPVRAISGNKDQIYFDSRIITPISKKLLSPSLALRQFVSAKKRYIGTIAITTILVFFMVSVSALGDIFNSKSAMQAIGIDSTDIDITLSDPDEFDKNSDEIESVIKKYTDIEDVFSYINTYVSLNGENLICKIYKEPNNLCILKGREPVYDNEIVVSQATSEEPGINIGDTAQVSKSNKSADFMVVGIIQCPNDLGRNFAINIDGIKRMGVEDIEISYVGYSLSSTEHCQEIKDELNEKYSDILSYEIYANDTNSIISSAFDTLKLIIYTISAVFALVVVIMVCKKKFLQEKTDIGIYKAVGFKCTKLRLQFSVRFLIVALISSSFGIILSLLLSESLFEWMFKNIGVVTFKIQLSAGTVIIPAVTICICFFVFAFIVSRQVKKVDVKELITE